ncbi:MAG: bifunctional methylenetetrahydrofolate dehydrogenase/methenyltetrahydrofolate cyclohydrolase FolD [Betaproteobacteria bacterium]|jgi:methylenetetrahydrofolate dehydrogenase (NADP+)/methenyltetrahydrofolate cyclohydrolase|nr:bifunctional methylenetetrahydrofolate dehydrogenase/methenyltetrahydrofolate cyclohydrolase FolD [Betaproteobacteria bacterium]
MAAQIIDGRAIAADLRRELGPRVAALAARGIRPCLAVVLVGDDPASRVYVRNKVRACAATGVDSRDTVLPAQIGEHELLSTIAGLNRDPTVHGVLVQLPLPPHLDAGHVIESISPGKDVDGFHPSNMGALLAGRPGFVPCTPAGIMVMLERSGVALAGKRAVVIGRSNIVGKPMALLLLQRDATVTICHSKTRDLPALTREADILVAAIGRPRAVGAAMVKPGACVIDVGINRLDDGSLAGDVDTAAVKDVAGWITPVPGGVGPMTVAMLIASCVRAAELAAASEASD